MKVQFISATVLALINGTDAVQLKDFAPFHGKVAQEHDMLLGLGEDPPPEVPGGESDGRYKSLWRNPWPHGIDNADNDEDVLNWKSPHRTAKKKPQVFTYPWTLDSEIVDSQKHIDDVEKVLDKEFEHKDYRDRAYNILNYGHKAIKSNYL